MIWKRRKSNLVIAAVGDQSIHKEWISDAKNKSFDLALIYYGDLVHKEEMYKDDAKYYLKSKGYKWHLISEMYDKFEKSFSNYEFIWCPDDDVSVNSESLSHMFRYCKDKGLNLAQPSMTSDSFIGSDKKEWPIVSNHTGTEFRFTNVVERMAPVFSRESFKTLRKTFIETKSGWGLDWVWPKILNYENCGVIDLIQIKHTKECESGELYEKYKKDDICPTIEKKKILRRYKIPLAICTEISNIERRMERVCVLHEVPQVKHRFNHLFRRDKGCSHACRKVGNRLLNFKNLID